MNKTLNTVFAGILSASLFACGTGGDDSGNNGGGGQPPVPTPPAASPSASIVDVRNLTAPGATELTLEFDVVVADAAGAIVTNLTNDDFMFTAFGALTPSALLSSPSEGSVANATGNYSVTVLLDSSDSMETSDPFDLRLGAVKSLGNLLKLGDEAQVIAFAGSATQLRDPIYDLPSQFYDIGPGFAGTINGAAVDQLAQWENGGSPLYDAVIHGLGTDGILNASNLAKAVLVLTDGENDNLTIVDQAIAAATVAGSEVPVYALGLGDGVNSAELQRLADETGGVYSEVDGAEQLESLLGSIAQVLSTLDPNVFGEQVHYTIRVVFADETLTRVAGEIFIQVDDSNTVSLPYSKTL